tara:strand:- start:140 stop:337 length:198 start_codon:yes stop_codon:yes gene_type:complete
MKIFKTKPSIEISKEDMKKLNSIASFLTDGFTIGEDKTVWKVNVRKKNNNTVSSKKTTKGDTPST